MNCKKEKAIPGYSGYKLLFEEQNVIKQPHRRPNKFDDTKKFGEHSLGDDMYATEYNRKFSEVAPGDFSTQIAKPTILKHRPYKPVKAYGWKSTSHATIEANQKVKADDRKKEGTFIGINNKNILRTVYTTPSSKHDFRTPVATNLTPTTTDLALGTGKGETIRIPGYSGHISQSELLKRKLKGNIRDSLVEQNIVLESGSYKHNKMGYTGHAPMDVTNDPRRSVNPAAKDIMKPGLRTGIAVHSMNLT
eukprot:CAMPEP_0197539188 /NCGR_PEP_ID=MMETSP1318-20131121/61907_1 /TAXON_ID=552666 /ORGANISM="Partenskyella glossopodia, Strain RCC365" /LENGTH=248 /DNA_ID=CAMNT_0043097829 /DNA_START=27 /DNA_END=773 /DNA_ORIENTATION=+